MDLVRAFIIGSAALGGIIIGIVGTLLVLTYTLRKALRR